MSSSWRSVSILLGCFGPRKVILFETSWWLCLIDVVRIDHVGVTGVLGLQDWPHAVPLELSIWLAFIKVGSCHDCFRTKHRRRDCRRHAISKLICLKWVCPENILTCRCALELGHESFVRIYAMIGRGACRSTSRPIFLFELVFVWVETCTERAWIFLKL